MNVQMVAAEKLAQCPLEVSSLWFQIRILPDLNPDQVPDQEHEC
jgi:hypothetical protein